MGENAFGIGGRTFISIIFFLELLAACVALVILSADSIVALVPELDLVQVKLYIVLFCLPITFPKSLQIASYGSLIGILALMNLLGILVYDGLSYQGTPGSLLNPADYTLLPVEYFPIPFSFGLLMAGFAGHSVFPSIYRDMKTPSNYPSLLNWTYSIIIIVYALIASIGYIMFGSTVKEEVSQNLPEIQGYSILLNQITVALIAINPISKYPLTMAPISHQIELWFAKGQCTIERVLICTSTSIAVLLVAIFFPGFHSIMALLGSFFSFSVSVVFPIAVYLKFYGSQLKFIELIFELSLALFGITCGLMGTVWVILSL